MMKVKTLVIFFCVMSVIQLLQAADFQGYQYISPKPNAAFVSPHATIIVRFDHVTPWLLRHLPEFHLEDEDGIIGGQARMASDARTIIFEPARPFAAGSIVRVSIRPSSDPSAAMAVAEITFEFTVASNQSTPARFAAEEDDAENELLSASAQRQVAGTARRMPNGVSVPSDFPHIEVTVNEETADGYIFLNAWRDDNPYNIIFANDGSPVWYKRTNDGDRRRDFKVQRNGYITMLVRGSAGYPFGDGHVAYDENFDEIRTFHAVNGYSTDEHELQVLEDGHYLLLGLRAVRVDMRQYVAGGQQNANVGVTAVQEFTPDGDLILLWDALEQLADYIPNTELEDLTSNSFRYPHMNAIDIDDDGALLLSCRNLSTVFKIDRKSGAIIWELGGRNSDFQFVDDPLGGFRNQHDIRSLGNGHYTVFDNGNLHNPPRSRAMEFVLDRTSKTATLVWEYRNPPGTSDSYYMGNAQRLPNGNTLIDWAVGDRPKATEVTPDGRVVYEMNFVDRYHCYRAFRFPWHGNVSRPLLIVEQTMNDVQLIFNKFGDPDVLYYNIYCGTAPNAITLLDTCQKTLKALTGLHDRQTHYIRVTAVHSDGAESDFSNEESVFIQKVQPNVNLVRNGDFSQGKTAWTYELQGGDADWQIEDGVCRFVIRSGGSPVYGVQLRQNKMPLMRGESYLFEFDAWAASPRTIEAKVGQDGGAYVNYSRIGLSALARSKRHFAYEFIMQDSDPNGRVVINVGASDEDVYLDNVSLMLRGETRVENAEVGPLCEFALLGHYPNPFNEETTIRFSVPEETLVRLELYNVLGQLEKMIVSGIYQRGTHQVRLDAHGLSSGVYFCRMTIPSHALNDMSKLVLIK